MLLPSCRKTIIPQEVLGETIVVSMGFGGDISVSQEPLSTKAGTPTNDLYGINVYYDVNKDGDII